MLSHGLVTSHRTVLSAICQILYQFFIFCDLCEPLGRRHKGKIGRTSKIFANIAQG